MVTLFQRAQELDAVKGKLEDKEAFRAALRQVKLANTPIGPIRIDRAESRAARLRHARRIGELCEARQPRSRPAQRLRCPVANGGVDDSRHDYVVRHGLPQRR